MRNILFIILVSSLSYSIEEETVEEYLKGTSEKTESKPDKLKEISKDNFYKEKDIVTCNVECSDDRVSLDDMSYEVVTINTAISCYQNQLSLSSFERCLKKNKSIVNLEEPKTSILESSPVVVGNAGNNIDR